MVTKGYRKGVYERVTLGIINRHEWLGQIHRYKDDNGNLVQTCYVAGVGGRLVFQCEIGRLLGG
jgi:hypothetical protein